MTLITELLHHTIPTGIFTASSENLLEIQILGLHSNLCCAVLNCSVVSDSSKPHGLYPTRFLLSVGILPVKILEGVSLLQGIFPTQGSNPGLLHCNLPNQKLEVGPEICFHKSFIWFKCMFNALIGSLQSPLRVIITVVLPGNPKYIFLARTVHLRVLGVPKVPTVVDIMVIWVKFTHSSPF